MSRFLFTALTMITEVIAIALVRVAAQGLEQGLAAGENIKETASHHKERG